MTDTSAEAVERLAAGIISDVGAHYSPGAVIITTARTVREAAATLRALVAERDAALAEAARMQEALERIAGVTMSMCLDHADMARFQRKTASAALASEAPT